jgi:hypothetical protein
MPLSNQYNLGGSGAIGPTSGGKTTAVNNVSTVNAQVIGPNPNRVRITFHNPGLVDILVAMVRDVNGAVLAPTFTSRGGSFLIFANGGEKAFDGECQLAFNAVAASGAANPLTIVETNT